MHNTKKNDITVIYPTKDRISIQGLPYANGIYDEISLIPGVLIDTLDNLSLKIDMPKDASYTDEAKKLFSKFSITVTTKNNFKFGVWEPNQTLYEHQIDGVKKIVDSSGGLLADSMGLGKTRTAIASAQTYVKYFAKPDSVRLIVAPKYLRSVWINELLATGAIKNTNEVCVLTGRNLYDEEVWDDKALWYFIHFDVIYSLWSRLWRRRPVVSILDEAHLCKNPKSQRYKGVEMCMMQSPFRLALTGTPILNRVSEMWPVLQLVCGKWSWGTRKTFIQRYAGATYDGYGWKEGNLTNTKEFKDRVNSFYIRRTVNDVSLKLPELTRTICVSYPSDNHKKSYREALGGYSLQEIIDAIDNKTYSSKKNPIIKILGELRKISSQIKKELTVSEIISALEQDESVVCFTWMKQTAKDILSSVKKETKKEHLHIVCGDDSIDDRDGKVSKFQSSGGLIVATYGALSVGVTLTKARIVIMHDLDWVPANMLQAEARVYRIGSKNNVISKWMVADGTLDEYMSFLLKAKGIKIQSILSDADPSHLFSMINENVKKKDFIENFLNKFLEKS